MNINLIDNVEFAGSGVDLYLMSADYNGVQMTEEELDNWKAVDYRMREEGIDTHDAARELPRSSFYGGHSSVG